MGGAIEVVAPSMAPTNSAALDAAQNRELMSRLGYFLAGRMIDIINRREVSNPGSKLYMFMKLRIMKPAPASSAPG
jgi:hypothetical protein